MSASKDTAKAKQATRQRRTIMRFALDSISIDDRPNNYKDAQLVLKPQLELATRKDNPKSRTRKPIWRHFLMVHIKDKADELVKLDLDIFKGPSISPSSRQASIFCCSSEGSFLFRYPSDTGFGNSTLRVTLSTISDVDAVLGELSTLNIEVEEQRPPISNIPGLARTPSGFLLPPTRGDASGAQNFHNPNQPLATWSDSQGQYLTSESLGNSQFGALLQRPPSQPLGHTEQVLPGFRPWSPDSVPSRPATALGVPGVLSEGLYKVSKVGSTVSSRPKLRRTPTILESQPPLLYTVSKQFDRALNQADIAAIRSRYLGRGLSSSARAEPVGLGSQPLRRTTSVLETTPMASTIQRSASALLPTTQDEGQTLTGRHGFASPLSFSQPEAASRALVPGEGSSIMSQGSTLLDTNQDRELDDEMLVLLSQVQHEGLCEASKLWDEFMQRIEADSAGLDHPQDASERLGKYEDEFTRRWNAVLAATVQRAREIRSGNDVY